MKRAGFTMIELIFVIVILGILSAVALPKFLGVSDQARVGKLTAYVGTLDRTVLPPYWSQSLTEGNNGSIATYSDKIIRDLPAPDRITVAFAAANLEPSSYVFTNGTAPTKTVGSKVYNGVTYTIACADGNATSAARCDVYNGSKWLLLSNQ